MEGRQPHMMLLQPWGVYVNGQSSNKAAAWDFVKFLTNAQNGLQLTEMTGWLSPRTRTSTGSRCWRRSRSSRHSSRRPRTSKYYVEPVLTAFDEIESRLADRLTAAYVDPSLKGNPQKVAARIHDMAPQTDQILKDADLYGTMHPIAPWPIFASSVGDGQARQWSTCDERRPVASGAMRMLLPVLALFAYVRIIPIGCSVVAQLLSTGS